MYAAYPGVSSQPQWASRPLQYSEQTPNLPVSGRAAMASASTFIYRRLAGSGVSHDGCAQTGRYSITQPAPPLPELDLRAESTQLFGNFPGTKKTLLYLRRATEPASVLRRDLRRDSDGGSSKEHGSVGLPNLARFGSNRIFFQ